VVTGEVGAGKTVAVRDSTDSDGTDGDGTGGIDEVSV